MAEWVGYRLAARSPLHLGDRGVGIEETSVTLRSDVLFSALCIMLRELGEDLNAFLARFHRVHDGPDADPHFEPGEEPPPLRLSSAFPYAGDVRFFPRPMLRMQGLDEISDPKLSKVLKKIQFVSLPIFEALLAGRPVADLLAEADPDQPGQLFVRRGVLLQNSQVWVTLEEAEQLREFTDPRTGQIRLWAEEIVPRVTVDRTTNQSQVYAAGQVRFSPGCGLFFLVEYGAPALQPRIETALRALGDAGVGGERSSGYGQFDLGIAEKVQMKTLPPDQANAFATLALFWPTQAEVQSDVLAGASYRLVNRRGWIASPDGMTLRRRGVRMLTEGSVLLKNPQGALADVKPLDPAPVPNVPHDVWRYGLAFPVHCRVQNGKGVADER